MNFFKWMKVLATIKEIKKLVDELGTQLPTEILNDAGDMILDTAQAIVEKLDPEDKSGIYGRLAAIEEKWFDPTD